MREHARGAAKESDVKKKKKKKNEATGGEEGRDRRSQIQFRSEFLIAADRCSQVICKSRIVTL